MLDYLICATFWLVFTLILTCLGRMFNKGERTLASDLVTGYLIYSFCVAVGGMVLQLLNVQWILFAIYMGVLWLTIIFSLIFSIRKNKNYVLGIQWKEYIKNNWILYVVCAVLVIALCSGYSGFWLGNHQDDGYYITKVATLPYGSIGGNMNYTLGIDQGGFTSYIFNTWESEASVYVKLLNVEPTLFLRLFQSTFYYFLFLNLLKVFAEKVIANSQLKVKATLPQYSTVIVLLFGMYYLFLSDTYFFRLRDMFHFNSGMFLGISVVKMMGIMFFLYFYMDKKRISINMILGIAGISVVLMSKSSVALPIIAYVCISALLVWLFFDYDKVGKYISSALLIFYCIVGVVIPDSPGIQQVVWTDMQNAVQSPIIWACTIIFVLSFSMKNRMFNKVNILCLLCLGFMLLPQVNDVFEHFSMYNFVGGRSLTTWLYFFVMLNFIYLILLLIQWKVKEKVVKGFCLFLAVCQVIVMIWGFQGYGGGVIPDSIKTEASIKHCLNVIRNNIYFIPDSTIELGRKLNTLSKESEEKLNVVTPKMIIMDGSLHALAIMLRIYAPDIVPISAAERFPVHNGTPLSEYKQLKYDAFAATPSDETAKEFEEEIANMNVGCIVVQNEACGKWLENMGYSLYDKTQEGSYFIWYKPQ